MVRMKIVDNNVEAAVEDVDTVDMKGIDIAYVFNWKELSIYLLNFIDYQQLIN